MMIDRLLSNPEVRSVTVYRWFGKVKCEVVHGKTLRVHESIGATADEAVAKATISIAPASLPLPPGFS